MRQETKRVMTAFIAGKRASGKNTKTDGTAVWLFGNKIAWKTGDDVTMTLAGWPTVTTRERLNGLCELLHGTQRFYQSNNVQYMGDSEIDDPMGTVTFHSLDEPEENDHAS